MPNSRTIAGKQDARLNGRADTARPRKALAQGTPTEETEELTPISAAPVRPSMKIRLNEKGELTISEAGSKKVDRTFRGFGADHELEQTDSSSLCNVRFAQIAGTLPQSQGKCATAEALNIALDGVAALAPRDGMEVMLCSQLVALHSQSMEFLRRGMLPEQTTDGVDTNVNRAAKLLRSFASMADCLRTYRGGGHQRVTVEHVTVQAGGQAIVGMVNRGGGDAQQTGG